MKCPKCTKNADGKDVPDVAGRPDMVRNLKNGDGRLYQHCTSCGFDVLEDVQPPTQEDLAVENAALKAQLADLQLAASTSKK